MYVVLSLLRRLLLVRSACLLHSLLYGATYYCICHASAAILQIEIIICALSEQANEKEILNYEVYYVRSIFSVSYTHLTLPTTPYV